jgi:hypothetical protein
MRARRTAVPMVLTLACTIGIAGHALAAGDFGELGDLVYIQNVTVAPGARDDPTQLTEAGVIDVDGYANVVLSLAFESKQPVNQSGTIGAILIPDYEIFDRLMDTWQIYGFPLEATIQVRPGANLIQVGEQVRTPVAFPRYRVLMYNSTDSTASVFLYAYRTRCGD